ncbi:MAG: hypothetical protein E6R12_11355 [Sphingomonadales bacterium]|nr:MAG: hypothetical protein E6R12_11355 [Sphingomonadales bacterium]
MLLPECGDVAAALEFGAAQAESQRQRIGEAEADKGEDGLATRCRLRHGAGVLLRNFSYFLKTCGQKPSMVARIFLLLCVACFAAAVPASARTLFGAPERQFASVEQFPKWLDMLARERRGPPPTTPEPVAPPPGADAVLATSGACRPGSPICARPSFPDLLAEARKLPRLEQLRLINKALNGHRYITDPENWGVPDYWAAVRQFLARNGDCEDYAIAKYMALKALGYSIDEMRIVVLQDENLGVPHAILAVASGDGYLILDNQIGEVLPDRLIVHYRPIYSINERSWWLHQPPG